MNKMNFTKPAALTKITKIRHLLSLRAMNAHELAEALPLSKRWVIEYMKHLHSTEQAHILRWDKHISARKKRHAIDVWALGPGVDAPRPRPDTPTERRKREWKRIKDDVERHISINQRRATLRHLKDVTKLAAANNIFQKAA